MVSYKSFRVRPPLMFLTYFDHNFRKTSELAIPEPFFMANCVSFYNYAGNLNVYSMFHRL